MKVASLVLNNFQFDNRVLKENASLAKAGYKPTVFALHDDGLPEEEIVHGFKVVRIKLRQTRSSIRFAAVFRYAEYLFKVYKYAKHFDIIHCNDLATLPMGVYIKLFGKKSIKIIYDAHEYETQLPYIGTTEIIARTWVERIFLKYINGMMTVSNEIADEYVKNYNIKKPAVVMNCPPYREPIKRNIFRETFNISNDDRIFLYQGALIPNRGIEQLLEAAQYANGNFALIFMGYGTLEEQIKEVAASNNRVFFQPAVIGNELLEYTSSADFGFNLLNNQYKNHQYTLTNKLFEYIMAGVIPVGNSSFASSQMMNRFDIGADIDKDKNRAAIVAILEGKGLPEIMSQREKLAIAAKELNWEKQEQVLLELYRTVSNK